MRVATIFWNGAVMIWSVIAVVAGVEILIDYVDARKSEKEYMRMRSRIRLRAQENCERWRSQNENI